MLFFWITALIDIFMKIIITREYIMKRKVLAMLVPALLVAGAANAAEIYNKDGNKVDFYGKMVGERIWSNTAYWLLQQPFRFSVSTCRSSGQSASGIKVE